MSGSILDWLRHPRLKPLALGPSPAWLWSADGSRVLWTNAAGAAIFGAPSPAALATRAFDGGQPAAAQVADLAATLAADGTSRCEGLRGFGAGIGRKLPCTCSIMKLPDGAGGVLIAANERAGPELALRDRVARLLAGCAEPIVAFAADGTLIHATPAARAQVGEGTSLASLGAGALAATAQQESHPAGGAFGGAISIDRIGDDAEPVLLVGLGGAAAAAAAPAAVTRLARNAGVLAAIVPTDRADSAATAAAPAAVAIEEPPAPATPPAETPHPPAAGGRRYPLRFVWQMDAEGRFTIDSPEFMAAIGPRNAALLGQRWDYITAAIGLDPDGQVARATATRNTWSGLTLAWPIAGSDRRLTVEMSGLPAFDRDRTFRGYRGFGVCRDLALLDGIESGANDRTSPAPPGRRDRATETAAQPSHAVTLHLPDETDAPALSPVERNAFYELARRLADRINEAGSEPTIAALAVEVPSAPPGDAAASAPDAPPADQAVASNARPLLDRLPIGILIYRLNHLLYANAAFLGFAGYDSVESLADSGGLDALMVEPGAIAIEEGGRRPFTLASPTDERVTAEARLLMVPWEGETAFALLTVPPNAEAAARADAAIERAREQNAELAAILDTATDGVVVIDRAARIVSANRSAQALFGYDAHELEGKSFSNLFAPESLAVAIDHLDRLQGSGVASLINDGRDIVGRERNGGAIPLSMSMGRLGDGGKFCAVFRDITPWKKTEQDLTAAKRDAERASAAKSEFLAKISHEIRTPLNAIIGFSEVMMEERFGPVGNERYQQYLKDIHASGGHLLSLVNDLLDLSKIEAGRLELTFADMSINDLTQQCVAIMQPQASRDRIIIRTALAPKLPPIVADARSVRQIVLNLLSNSIKFTGAGGQVIVATALTDAGDVSLRVRDTGIGMSEKDIAIAMEPFRQIGATARGGAPGTGLGLPLTKALAEANRATFHLKSTPNAGTLVEVVFTAAKVLTPS